MPSKFFFVQNKIFCFIGPPLLQSEFRAGMDMGKKDMAAQKMKKEKKRAFFFLSCSLFLRWVAAGLARPATAAAAATGTTAATFIDWIDLAAPPVTFFTWHRFADPGYPNVGHFLPGSCMTWHHQHLHQRNTEHSLEVQGCDNHKNIA